MEDRIKSIFQESIRVKEETLKNNLRQVSEAVNAKQRFPAIAGGDMVIAGQFEVACEDVAGIGIVFNDQDGRHDSASHSSFLLVLSVYRAGVGRPLGGTKKIVKGDGGGTAKLVL